MTRRHIDVSVDIVSRAIKGVQKAGIEVKSIRVEPSGAVVINGDNTPEPEETVAPKKVWAL